MARFRSTLLPEALRTLFRRPETVRYPFGPAELQEGYRGRVVVHAERCTGCSLCVRDCPAFALELERESKDRYRLIYHPDRCAYCGQCEDSCRFDCIYLTNEFVPGTGDRETLTTVLVDHKPAAEGGGRGAEEQRRGGAEEQGSGGAEEQGELGS